MHLKYLAKGDFEPYWGNSTSSVNWCEVDYEYSSFVAELFNTLSSLSIVLAGLMGSVLHWHWIKFSFHFAFLSTTLVGLGSVAFHATLKKSTQALDEVPMLFSAMSFLYLSILLHFNLKANTKTLLGWYSIIYARALFIHAILTSSAVIFLEGTLQFIVFHLSFGTAELASLISCFFLYSKTTSDISRKSFQFGMSSYLFAILVWQFEIHYCPYLNPFYPQSVLYFNPQLHMFWHIMVSIGLYLLALMMLNENALKEGKDTQLVYFFGIPSIQIKPKID